MLDFSCHPLTTSDLPFYHLVFNSSITSIQQGELPIEIILFLLVCHLLCEQVPHFSHFPLSRAFRKHGYTSRDYSCNPQNISHMHWDMTVSLSSTNCSCLPVSDQFQIWRKKTIDILHKQVALWSPEFSSWFFWNGLLCSILYLISKNPKNLTKPYL